jgi:hypothetical protein
MSIEIEAGLENEVELENASRVPVMLAMKKPRVPVH